MDNEPMNIDAMKRASDLLIGTKGTELLAMIYHAIADAQQAAYGLGYQRGVDDGYVDGYAFAELDGYEQGADDGYLDGVRDARSNPAGADATIKVIMDEREANEAFDDGADYYDKMFDQEYQWFGEEPAFPVDLEEPETIDAAAEQLIPVVERGIAAAEAHKAQQFEGVPTGGVSGPVEGFGVPALPPYTPSAPLDPAANQAERYAERLIQQ